MRFSNQGRLREQVKFLRRQYLQDGALPFSDILTDDFVTQAMTAFEGVWKDRIYTPLMTLWVFLTQVLSADHSCRVPSPASSPIVFPRVKVPVHPRQVLTARPGSDCRSSSLRP